MSFFIFLFVFLFGLIVGSFLNAAIYRLEKGESALKGRSYCPQCKHLLAWHDLVPLLSFAFLGGRCRYCKKPISWQYPIVETATGLLFLLIFNYQFFLLRPSFADGFGSAQQGFGGQAILNEFLILEFLKLVYLFAIASLLLVIFVYDLRHYLIPDKILFPAIGTAFAYHIFVWVLGNWNLIQNSKFNIQNFETLINPFLAGTLAASFFFALFLFSRGKWMGFGDVKLAFFMGLFLGFPQVLEALFIAFLAGAIIGIALIVLKKKKFKSEIPFGPFLIAGTLGTFLFGEELVRWYWSIVFL